MNAGASSGERQRVLEKVAEMAWRNYTEPSLAGDEAV
jgi:hypothetical protein